MPQKGTYAWYYKLDRKPIQWGIIDPVGEPAAVVMLNGQVVKLLRTSGAFSLGQRSLFLQRLNQSVLRISDWEGSAPTGSSVSTTHPPKGQHCGRGGRKNVSRKHGEECYRMLPSGCAVDMTVRNSPGICGVLCKSNTTEPSAFQQEALRGLDGFP